MNNKKFVEVLWYDIIGTSGWEKPDEVTLPLFKTYGYLIHKDKKCIKVAHTFDVKDKTWSGITAFPRGCVEKISTLSGGVEVKTIIKLQDNQQ